jgi:hypothetical protein
MERIGRRYLNSSKPDHQFNAFTDGAKYSNLVLSKDLGQLKKIKN